MASEANRVQDWQNRWDEGVIGFHKLEVHAALTRYFDKLFPDGKGKTIFVPLCGKTLDMKWLADQGMSVVGLDAVRKSIEQFLSEQNLEFSSEKFPKLGEDSEVFKCANSQITLYLGDMMKLSPDIAGTFDAVWDRGSLVALNREDVAEYVKIIKSLIKPGGRCLLELFDYDINIMEDVPGKYSIPPPHPMSEAKLKEHYEPEFTVEHLDRSPRQLGGRDVHTCYYLLTKK